ncbi:MAG TPA: hypothetical protein VNJ04_05045 [Gemmatimonadaceae bacterium]|nr:hypothetical protein [Gemmatimonadaceae bacterium]
MEWVAFLAREPHSDAPACACPTIAAFMRSWNDALPDDATRTRLLAPLLPLIVGTRSASDKVLVRRSYLAIDWSIRTSTPAWLRCAGLTEHANAMADLPEIVDMAILKSAHKSSAAARAAAGAAASAAAGAAASDVTPRVTRSRPPSRSSRHLRRTSCGACAH